MTLDVEPLAAGENATPGFCSAPWLSDPCDCDQLTGLPDERQDLINEMAAFMLWKATGSKFGPCPTTVRPCGDDRVRCHRCGGALFGHSCCGCRTISEVTLPGPVQSIIEVIVNGEVVPSTDYRVDDWAWLVNLTGVWPRCSDPLVNADDDGSFVITYNRGLPPPAGAGLVTAELACELAKAFCGDKDCQLPGRIVSKTRQGVQVSYDDLTDGKTGLPSVDMWVAAANNNSRPSRVFSPDLPKHRTTTWP